MQQLKLQLTFNTKMRVEWLGGIWLAEIWEERPVSRWYRIRTSAEVKNSFAASSAKVLGRLLPEGLSL